MKLLLLIAVLSLSTFGVATAQEESATSTQEATTTQTITLGSESITYTISESIKNGTLFYSEDGATGERLLVASTHDTNEDDRSDVWLVYASDATVRMEAHDTDGDANPDTYITLTPQGTVSQVSGAQAESLAAPQPVSFSPLEAPRSNADLVGDLSDVSIQNQSPIWIFFIIPFIAGLGVYFFLRRQREK